MYHICSSCKKMKAIKEYYEIPCECKKIYLCAECYIKSIKKGAEKWQKQ